MKRRWAVGRGVVPFVLICLWFFVLPGCGGGGGNSDDTPSASPDFATDSSGDFTISAHAVSPDRIHVWWDDPSTGYVWPVVDVHSDLNRGGYPLAADLGSFSYTDSVYPHTTYCYNAFVTGWYQVFWTWYSYGWASGTVCVTTPYGFRVRSTSPHDLKVPVDAVVAVTFNGQPDPATVDSASFILEGPSGPVAGSIAAEGFTVTFTPRERLGYDARYTATVTTGIRDIDGYTLPSDHSWSFTTGLARNQVFQAVWGLSGSDVLVVSSHGSAVHYDGNAWTPLVSPSIGPCYDMWGTSGGEILLKPSGDLVWSYDGTVWDGVWLPPHPMPDIFGIWAASASDIFMVTDGGGIYHYDGIARSLMDSGATANLLDVWGASGSDVTAVGQGGTILHYDGAAWSATASGTGVWLNGIWGADGSDVFVVGDGGTILHYDGTGWSPMTSGTGARLLCVWGFSGSDVFAAGDGIILHYDGSDWSVMVDDAPGLLFGVWGPSGDDMFAVGSDGQSPPTGLLLHFDGNSWSSMVQ